MDKRNNDNFTDRTGNEYTTGNINKKKIGMVSLGCPKNLVDSEIMLGHLKNGPYEIVSDKDEAEIIIVNTCGFIESARQESINTILEMARCKENKCRLLIVTGCMAEQYKDEIIREMPEVDAVVGTGSYGEIARVIEEAEKGSLSGIKPQLYGELTGTDYLESYRVISTGKSSVYLKISEGCDNCCTYCIIPSLRGPFRSRPLENIVSEAKKLAENGAREIILIGQDTTRYGTDLYNERKLVPLLRELSNIETIEWIRLMYCYPDEIDDELIYEIASNEKICKYLDIPIQHASPKILKLMGRRGTAEETCLLLERLRERIPGVVLRTSLIVGFPGEDENDFALLEDFVRKYRFDRLGVFMYSKENRTPAAKMKPQVPRAVKKKRYNRIIRIQQGISRKKNMDRVGNIYKVLCEGVADDGIFYYGRSYAEAPDIDGVIYFTSEFPVNTGSFVDVLIVNSNEYDLTGAVSNESSE